MPTFDAIVLGSGQAGNPLSQKLGDLGWSVPPLEGLDRVGYLTNATLMELKELPEHLLVLGGGYIGLEFGQMFRRFGSQVTVVHRGPQILPREDADVAEELQKALEG